LTRPSLIPDSTDILRNAPQNPARVKQDEIAHFPFPVLSRAYFDAIFWEKVVTYYRSQMLVSR
jgi:hypothetical protein